MDSWPNQEALNKALNIYRASMRPFIISRLKQIQGTNVESTVTDSLGYKRAGEIHHILTQPNRSIESAIDVNDFPHLVSKNWEDAFEIPLNDDKTFRNQLWLIMECRNADWAHPPEGDAECESTRVHMFLIAEVLRKINRSDKQREVELIRDELFSDDTAERLEKAEADLKVVKAENAEYEKSVAEAEQRSKDAEAEKNKYEKDNAKLSNQVNEKDGRLKKLSRQLKTAKTGRDKYKKDLAATKKLLDKSDEAKADYKARLETTSKELKDSKAELDRSEKSLGDVSDRLEAAQAEKSGFVERLAAMKGLFVTATLDKPEIRSVFPALDTDTSVRILDRRGTDKRNYLLELLEQKQPTIIYVQNEEKIDLLLDRVLPEKEDVIGRHDVHISEAQEMEILEKLASGELVAVVSNTTFSTLESSHCVEHFVFCHLAPDLDVFFKRCQSAFTSTKNAYLHLIYESKQNVEELRKKYPSEEALRTLYQKFRDCIPIEGECINPENLYSELCQESELDMTLLGIETGFSIFEELGFVEKKEEGIRHLSTTRRELEESRTYCRGEKLKKETVNCPAYQYEQSIEHIWEKILKELNLESEQVVRENNIDEIACEIPEVEDDAESTTGTDRNKVTPPTPTIWPQRGIKTFSALREHATNNSAAANTTLNVPVEPISAELNERPSLVLKSVKRSPLSEDIEDYRNKYDLAMQFVQEHGVGALEQGIAQLIKDRDDPDYDFTEDETNMLRAFQHALTDFQIQSEESAAEMEVC